MPDEITQPEWVTAKELAARGKLPDYSHSFPCHMHFNGPGDSGFGVKKVTMLLPECAMLMVSPCGCGRSGTVVGQKGGFEERVFYYQTDDRDLVTGRYLDRLPEAGREIIRKIHPRAILICMTCVDSLLGTDLVGLCRKMTRELGIPVTGSFMDPMNRESSRAPIVKVQQAIADCLLETGKTDSGLNLVGNFAVPDESCELSALLSQSGFGPLRTLAGCASYDDFLHMADSAATLVLQFQGEAAAKDMQKKLEIPYVRLEPTYAPDRTEAEYAKLASFLKVHFSLSAYDAAARRMLQKFAAEHKNIRIGIGEAVIGSPLELAETLLDAGIKVPFVFRNLLYPGDRETILRLAQKAPSLRIYSGVHPTTRRFADALPEADVAVGLDAGYFLPQAVSISWSAAECHFGFELLTGLLLRMEQGIRCPRSHKEQMTGSYLTV